MRVRTSFSAYAAVLALALITVAVAPSASGAQNGPIVLVADTGNGASWQLYAIDPSKPKNQPVQLTHLAANPNFDAWNPQFSPDGKQIVFVYQLPTNPGLTGNVYIARADGTNVRKLTSDNGAFAATWSADGTQILVGDFATLTGRPALGTIPANGGGSLVALTDDLFSNFVGWYTPNGRIVYCTQQGGVFAEVGIMNADGTNKRSLTSAAEQFCPGAVSPDGKTVLVEIGNSFGANTPNLPNVPIYAMNVDGTGLRQLTYPGTSFFAVDELPAAYSPDGSKIAFASNRSNPNLVDLWVMNADGSSPTHLATGLQVGWPEGGVDGRCCLPTWGARQ